MKQYIIIWKDREGNIHRTEHFARYLGYLLWSYMWSTADWQDSKGVWHHGKTILYIFKQK